MIWFISGLCVHWSCRATLALIFDQCHAHSLRCHSSSKDGVTEHRLQWFLFEWFSVGKISKEKRHSKNFRPHTNSKAIDLSFSSSSELSVWKWTPMESLHASRLRESCFKGLLFWLLIFRPLLLKILSRKLNSSFHFFHASYSFHLRLNSC